ncbi:hypothetical protein L3Y34_006233 [Caenorhabditis briggsae]|uniref:T20D4.11-like domain-containing protein n=2 Tax=Caenorhabditis briggsae TaxID=6238 RepID=A0AAE8ZTS0_CAEBR|nr:hypothetical protein L3Y34_006233 [Caenorhabditis briggsae]
MMVVSKDSILIAILLISFAPGASCFLEGRYSSNCTFWEYIRDDYRCIFEYLAYARDVTAIETFGSQNLKSLERSCSAVESCFLDKKCHDIKSLRKIKAVCKQVLYFNSPTFVECERNVAMFNATCAQGTGCEYFGVDNCAVPIIKIVCGQEKWAEYRDAIITAYRGTENNTDCDWEMMKTF